MKANYLAAIDWSAPWLAPYRELGQALAQSDDWRSEMNRLARQRSVCNFKGQPICFIPQEALPSGVPYEAHIGSTGEVPTRDNLHDFFNGLVWLHFPKTKAKLNQLQYGALQSLSQGEEGQYIVGNARGRLRDAATIFDENGALLLCSQAGIAERIRAHEWMFAFFERRDEFLNTCCIVLFGHALMEKLVKPYAAITAHWIEAPISSGTAPNMGLVEIDVATQSIFATNLSTANFSPLPIFGVPGWRPEQDSDFYSNTDVFRPKRRSRI